MSEHVDFSDQMDEGKMAIRFTVDHLPRDYDFTAINHQSTEISILDASEEEISEIFIQLQTYFKMPSVNWPP